MSTQTGVKQHSRCTGPAWETAQRHADEPKADEHGDALTLFSACYCPFVQRAWIALEHIAGDGPRIPYKYYEIDPYAKPPELLEVNPKGLVPALRLGSKDDAQKKCIAESAVILEYLDDRYRDDATKKQLLPPYKTHSYERARQRLASDHINRLVVPAFYRLIQAQEADKQVQLAKEYVDELKKFESNMLPEQSGVFWNGTDDISYSDAMIAPWIVRTTNVLKEYRGLELEKVFDSNSRFLRYTKALLEHPSVKATTSTDQLYIDSYARYAENRPNTSQVANAINNGRGLP